MIKKDLVVIGSSNMDLVITMPRIPLAGETILGGKSSMVYGGKGANQAVAAARAGCSVAFITKLGQDIFGEKIRTHLLAEGLPGACILTDEQEPTGIAQIFVSAQGENVIAVAPGSNGTLSPKDIRPFEHLITEAQYILIQLEIPLETVQYVIKLATAHQVKVILNPAPARDLDAATLAGVWMLTPNEFEAAVITKIQVANIQTAHDAAKAILDKGVQQVIVTMGEHGSLWCNSDGYELFNAFQVVSIDSTAAGDVFNGAMARALTQNKSIEDAIRFASAAAAISVTRPGAQPSIPYLEEIEKFLHTFAR